MLDAPAPAEATEDTAGGDLELDGGKQIELKGLTGMQRVYAIGW